MKNVEKQDTFNVKSNDIKELEAISNSIRNLIINTVSKNGGHFSSNLGNVESIVALYHVFDFPKDKLIFDVGHQCYAHKILSNRDITKLRIPGGISGFQDIYESEFDYLDSGHSSTSIAQAIGATVVKDIDNKDYQVIAYIGDGSFTNGLVYEGLNELYSLNKKIIIVINDNNMSITKTPENLGTIFDFNNDRFDYINNVNGHDFNELIDAFKRAKNNNKTTIIRIKTIKGKGYKYSENDTIGFYHKVNPFDLKTGANFDTNSNQFCYMAASYLKENIEKDAIVINPSTMITSTLLELKNELKDRFIDAGMAEGSAAIIASSIGLKKHAYLFINSSFGQRAFDQFIHDIARINSHVTVFLDKIGLIGIDGATHQGIYDLGYLKTIPNINIYTPSNRKELIDTIKMSQNKHNTIFIRLSLENQINLINKPIKITLNNNVGIISYGNQFNDLLNNFNNNLIKIDCLKPFIINQKSIENLDTILVYDRYSTLEGFYSLVATNFALLDCKIKLIPITLKDDFIKFDSIENQLKENKASIADLINYIKENKYGC